MELDVRKGVSDITVIRFADYDADDQISGDQADILRNGPFNQLELIESHNGDYVRVNGVEHARNLIKALEKAIELGWLK
ncbi:hypothetical protein D3C78_1253280 [compost metagenome]